MRDVAPLSWMMLLVVGFAACDKPAEEAAVPEEAPEKIGVVEQEVSPAPGGPVKARVLHAMLGVGEVSIKIDGLPLVGADQIRPYAGTTPTVSFGPGQHLITVEERRAEGERVEVARDRVEAVSEGAHWLLLVGEHGAGGGKGYKGAQVRLLRDDQAEEVEGKAPQARVINAAVGVPPVDVEVGDGDRAVAMRFVNVGFGKGTAYRTLAPGTHKVVVRSGLDSEKAPLYHLQKAALEAEGKHTLVLTNQRRQDHPLDLWLIPPLSDDDG